LITMLATVGRSERRQHGSLYVQGLLLDGERKSIEPLARRVPGGNVQALQQFVGQSPWAWEPVRRLLAQHLEEALLPAAGWIIDDTGLAYHRGQPTVLREVAAGLPPEAWREVTWRRGTQESATQPLGRLPGVTCSRPCSRSARGGSGLAADRRPAGAEVPTQYWFWSFAAALGAIGQTPLASRAELPAA
jgi:hypothetical protein